MSATFSKSRAAYDTPTPLANAKILIRPFEPGDADEFVRAAYESIDTVGKWMIWCTPSFTRDKALGWFATCDQDRAAGRAYDMGLFCAVTGQLLGGAGINQLSPHHRYGNIGYWVRQSQQGKGIARQAVALLRDFGFTQLDLGLATPPAKPSPSQQEPPLSVGPEIAFSFMTSLLMHIYMLLFPQTDICQDVACSSI